MGVEYALQDAAVGRKKAACITTKRSQTGRAEHYTELSMYSVL